MLNNRSSPYSCLCLSFLYPDVTCERYGARNITNPRPIRPRNVSSHIELMSNEDRLLILQHHDGDMASWRPDCPFLQLRMDDHGSCRLLQVVHTGYSAIRHHRIME